ncbi:pectin lyase fold protein [Vibrio phage 1.133.O._10N.222.51.E4]|nr:pectin lyase fold protein [Vibrio phage 1.133.O._10N.222.51.E4]
MSCSDFPTIQTAKTFKLDAETVNEVVTSSDDRTQPASDGLTKKTLAGIETDAINQLADIQQRADEQYSDINNQYVLRNKGDYATDPLLEFYYEFTDFNGSIYFPIVAPHQVDSATYPDPSSDPNLRLGQATDDSLVTSTGSTTPRRLDDRFADVVNIRDFGALGDGVTDDTPAISQAITLANALGKSVYYGGGDFLLSSALTSGYNFVIKTSQIGDGARLLYHPADASVAINLFQTPEDEPITGIEVSGFEVEGFGGVFFNGLYLYQSLITNNELHNSTIAFITDEDGVTPQRECVHNTISNNTILLANYREHPSYQPNPTDEQIREWGGRSFGIRFASLPLEQMHVRDEHGCSHNTISNNYIEYAAYSGFELAGPKCNHNVIQGNTFNECSGTGLEFDKGASYNTCDSNSFNNIRATEFFGGVAQGFIQLQRASTNVPIGNNITNCTFYDSHGESGVELIKIQGAALTSISNCNVAVDSPVENAGFSFLVGTVADVGALAGSLTVNMINCTGGRLSILSDSAGGIYWDHIRIDKCKLGGIVGQGATTTDQCAGNLSIINSEISHATNELDLSRSVVDTLLMDSVSVDLTTEMKLGNVSSTASKSKRVIITNCDIKCERLNVSALDSIRITNNELHDFNAYSVASIGQAKSVIIDGNTFRDCAITRFLSFSIASLPQGRAVITNNYNVNLDSTINTNDGTYDAYSYNNLWDAYVQP